MLEGLRNLFATGAASYADPKAMIPVGAVLDQNWFEFWHQPKIELRTMHLVGAEALVRDVIQPRHRSTGPFPPGASEADMHALTERVILTAIGDWEDFADRGVSIRLAVNVAASALIELPIPQMLREARPRAANWPGLTFEVTEDQILIIWTLQETLPTRCGNSNAISRWMIWRRLFIARPPEAIAVQRAQDRPQLCGELQSRPVQCGFVRDDCRTGPALQSQNCGRGHRNNP